MSGMSPRAFSLAVGAVGIVVATDAVVLALAADPPALAWLAFALASAVALALAAAFPLAFERTRVSPLTPAAAPDSRQRLLVVADSNCSVTGICDAVLARGAAAADVHLVVPIRVSHLHFVADDEDAERRAAASTLSRALRLLEQHRVAATGAVGDDKPLESMSDALGRFAATRVLLITPPPDDAYWLERDLLAKTRRLTDVPVAQAVVLPARPPARAG